MKLTFSLCLLLAAGCSAHMSFKDMALQPFVGLQEKAMRSLISAHAASDDPNLINDCFNQYIKDQQSTLANYNAVYSNCVATAQVAKNKVTAQSDEQRRDLLQRSDNMCDTLASCESLDDGLKFFDCYRNASADSYKVMFTLNSDANTQYNTVGALYSNIDTNLTKCVDTARLDYARELEKCDSDFNICVGNEIVTEAPATEAPATEAPATEAPATEAPATEDPATEAPATEAPATEAPATEAPATEAPATEAPATEAAEPTTEQSPEEDLKFLPLTFSSKLQKLMQLF